MIDKPKATDLFNSKLMVAGYVEDAEEFDELFELTRTRTYRVLDEFLNSSIRSKTWNRPS